MLWKATGPGSWTKSLLPPASGWYKSQEISIRNLVHLCSLIQHFNYSLKRTCLILRFSALYNFGGYWFCNIFTDPNQNQPKKVISTGPGTVLPDHPLRVSEPDLMEKGWNLSLCHLHIKCNKHQTKMYDWKGLEDPNLFMLKKSLNCQAWNHSQIGLWHHSCIQGIVQSQAADMRVGTLETSEKPSAREQNC